MDKGPRIAGELKLLDLGRRVLGAADITGSHLRCGMLGVMLGRCFKVC